MHTRIEALCEKHRRFLLEDEQDFMLGVRIKVDKDRSYAYRECLEDPRKALERSLELVQPWMEVESDFIPTIWPIQLRMIWTIASMFGCPMEIVSGDAWGKPVIADIRQVEDLKPPRLDSGILPQTIRILEYFRNFAPSDVPIMPPSEHSPFNIACMLRGADIYLDIYEHPEELKLLLDMITTAFIEVEWYFKEVLGEPNHHRFSMGGFFVPGLRLAADNNVNLAPDQIREFEIPYLERIAAEFGSLAIHYCGTPRLTGRQFAEVLAEQEFVRLVHTQLEVYLGEDGPESGGPGPKLASIWEIRDLPDFIERHIDQLRAGPGAAFFVQTDTRSEAEALLARWPGLRERLLH